MSDVVSDERREIVRSILKQAQIEIGLALDKLDTYDKPHFLEIEHSAGALINFFPDNDRNGGCY